MNNLNLYPTSFPPPPSQNLLRNHVIPTAWVPYPVPQQIIYRQPFVPSTIPFQQPIALPHQPQHLMHRVSRAVVIIDPKTKEPIKIVKPSSSKLRLARNNLSPNLTHDEYSRKEQFEGNKFNKNRPKVKFCDTNQYQSDITECPNSDNVIRKNDVLIQPEERTNTDSHEPDQNISINVPTAELENIVNDEADDSTIILSVPVQEVKQDIDLPIVTAVIDDQILDETTSTKSVKTKVPKDTKISNESISCQLSKKNAKNKRRRQSKSSKQPYQKSKKEINNTTAELCINDKQIESECKRTAEIIINQLYNVLRYSRDDLLLLMSSKESKIVPTLNSRCVRIQTNYCSLMKTLKKNLKNVSQSKTDICELKTSLSVSNSCPSLLKYPQGMIRISLSETKVMNTVENAWTPKCRQINIADSFEQEIIKKFRSVLNKLCPENFNKMLDEVQVMDISSSSVLNECIRLLFEKAIADVSFAPTYALMCASLSKLQKDNCLFVTHLVSFCQEEFERFQKGFDNDTDEEGQSKFHRDTIGTAKFIGELYNIKIVDDKIAGDCIQLLMDPKTIGDVTLESLCNLLKTIGSRIEENNQIPELIEDCFNQLVDIVTNKTVVISTRIKFAIMDLIELKKSNWKVRRIIEAPKKLNEIVDAMQKQDAENTKLTRKCSTIIRSSVNNTNLTDDQRLNNVKQNDTKDEVLVQNKVENKCKPFDIVINSSMKVQNNPLQLNKEQEYLSFKKMCFNSPRKNRSNRSFERTNTPLARDIRNDNRQRRRNVDDMQKNNGDSKNSMVNNRFNESYDNTRSKTAINIEHSHCNDKRINYDQRNRQGNHLNRQQWNSSDYNYRKDIPRNNNNQHGDQLEDKAFLGCYRFSTANRKCPSSEVLSETWRSKNVGQPVKQNHTSREPINTVRQETSNTTINNNQRPVNRWSKTSHFPH